jgi:hypothetical protein
MLHFGSSFIWFIVPLSTQFIFKAPILIAHNTLKNLDQGWTEQFSGQGIFLNIINTTKPRIHYTPIFPNSYITSAVLISSLLIFSLLITCFNSLTFQSTPLKLDRWIFLKTVCMV